MLFRTLAISLLTAAPAVLALRVDSSVLGAVEPRPKYKSCGSRGMAACPSGHRCIDNPYRPRSCGMACDIPGICVPSKPTTVCGGFLGVSCTGGMKCVQDPKDKYCSDCQGQCV